MKAAVGFLCLIVLFFLRGFFLSLAVAGYTWIQGYPMLFSPFSSVGFHHVELRHLRFYSNRRDLLLTAPSIRVTFSPRILFFNRSLTASVLQVDLHEPTLILNRSKTGRWKTSFRFPQISPDLLTNLRIFRGHVEISDELWKSEKRPAEVNIGPIQGYLDFSNQKFAKILLVSGETSNGFVQISGMLLRPTWAGKIAINAYEASFAGIGDYWIHRGDIHLTSGVVSGDATLLSANQAIVSTEGNFQIRNGLLVYAPNPRLNASGLRCDIAMNTGIFRISGIHGDVFGTPFNGQGVIRMSGEPDFYFFADPVPFEFSRFSKNLTGKGVLSSVTFSGKEPHYRVKAAVDSPDVHYESIDLGALSADFGICDGLLSIQKFSLREANEGLTATGNFSPAASEGWLSAEFQQEKKAIRVNAIWRGGTANLILGQADGTIENFPLHSVLFGSPSDLYLLDRIGFVHWNGNGKWSGEVSSLNFPFHFQNKEALVGGRFSGDLFFGEKPGGVWAFGLGKIVNPAASYRKISLFQKKDSPVSWSVAFFGKKKAFSTISPSLLSFGTLQNGKISRLAFAGNANAFNLNGSVLGSAKGDLRHPSISTDLYAEGSRLSKPVVLSADLRSDLQSISSNEARLVWGKSAYDIRGTITMKDGYPLNVNGDVIAGQLSDAIDLFPRTPDWLEGVKGSLSGRFSLSGSLKKPEGLVHFYIHEGSLWDQPIATAYTDARIKNGVFYLNPFIARTNEDYFIARGSIGMNGPASLTFDAPNVQLSDLVFLRRNVGVVLGNADLHGRLSGLISSPSLIASLSMNHLHAKYLHLDSVRATLDYRRGWADIQNAEITSGSGRMLGYIGAHFAHPVFLSTHLIFSGVDPETVSNVHDLNVLGLLDGSVSLNGPVSAMNGNFDLNFSKERPISGELAGNVTNSTVDFSTMRVAVGNGELSGTGRLKVGQAGTVHVQGRNLDLALLSNLLHLKRTVSGKAFLTGDIHASLQNPEMSADVHILDPAFGGYAANDFRGRLLYRNGAFVLNDATLDVPHGAFNLYGLLPVSIGSQKTKSPLLLHVKLDHQDLGIVDDFFPGIKSKGLLQADLQLSKLRDQIELSGSAEISGGKVLPQSLSTPIENLNGTLTLENRAVTIGLTGNLTNPFNLQGTVAWDPSITSDMKFSGNNLHLTSPGLFDMNLSSSMELAHTIGSWMLKGATTVNPASLYAEGFNPGIIRKFLAQLGPINLDESLTFGDNVQLHHPHLNVYGSGTVHVGGTGQNPRLSGELDGTKGTLEFLGYIFDVRKVTAKFDPDHDMPYLTFVGASARRIQGSQIFVRLEGYPDNLHLSLNSYPPIPQDVLSRTLASAQPTETYLQANSNIFLQSEASHWLSTGLPSEVFFPVENVFSSVLNLEEFSLQFLPTGQLGLQVGKSISPHFLVTYAQPITGTQLQSQQTSGSIWGVEYHLSPRVFIQMTQSHLTGIGGQVLSRWNF